MKARQARVGTGTPIFYISNSKKEEYAGLFMRSVENESFIDPEMGRIHVDNSGEKTKYIQYFESLCGYVKDVLVTKTPRNMPGKGIITVYDTVIILDSDGTELKIKFGCDSPYGRSFSQRFRNINLDKEITLAPYCFINKEGKSVQGMNVFKGDSMEKEDKYEPFYNKDNTPVFEKESREGVKFDFEAYNLWLYKKFIDDVYYAFNHYEEPEKKEEERYHKEPDQRYDPGNRKDYRDDNRSIDDNRNNERSNERREEPSREEPRRDDRLRDDDRRSDRRDDDRMSDRRNDDRRGVRDDRRDDDRREERDRDDRRDSRRDDQDDDRDYRRASEDRRSDGKLESEVTRPVREEVVRVSRDEYEAARRPSETNTERKGDNYNPNAGMERDRNRDDDYDLPF